MPRIISGHHPRRRTTMLWAGGAFAAVLLVLGVNGTLSSWTSAIITNDTNTTSSADAVRLVETSGQQTCDTGTSPTNSVVCSQINKYGGTASPMGPGDVHHVTVTLLNKGTGPGSLGLAPAACHSSLVTPGQGDASADACNAFTVHVSCTTTTDGTFDSGTSTLSAFTGGTIGTLAPNASADCTFDVALPADAQTQYAGHVASQSLQWTLTIANP